MTDTDPRQGRDTWADAIEDREKLADALDYWAAQFMRGEGVFFGEHYFEQIAQTLYDAAKQVRKEAAQ